MLKLVAQNKYKLMAFIIGLYLLVDVLGHKGQARVLFPENFAEPKHEVLSPGSSSFLMNKDKNWKKAVNTKEQMNEISSDAAGFECDVYFDTSLRSFVVHHDPDKNIGYSLGDLLQLYQQKKMNAGIWLDIKNMDNLNAPSILHALIELRNKYYLQNKILVESGRADLLTAFSDSNFFTSYYIPLFNPYKMSKEELNVRADSISTAISKSKINALSCYYFQCRFLKHYFPQYPVLTWTDNDRFSLVNFLFQRKLNADKSIFIALKP
ncbi:MAG: FAM151A/B family protein [Ferruginibacter sp.]